MKLCKDCKHCVPDVYEPVWYERLFGVKRVVRWQFAKCNRNNHDEYETSFVDGTRQRKFGVVAPYYCSTERSCALPITCGPEGKYWEAK